MYRQKFLKVDFCDVNKVHLEKQTLKIKNVGLNHQLTILKDDVQHLIIQSKELSRVKENLYCLLEKVRGDNAMPSHVQSQQDREAQVVGHIHCLTSDIQFKTQQIDRVSDEYDLYSSKHSNVIREAAEVAQGILQVEESLEVEGSRLKEVKEINCDLEKIRRVLQDEKNTSIQLQDSEKNNHQEFCRQYHTIMERLKNDEITLGKITHLSQRRYALLVLGSLFNGKITEHFRRFTGIQVYYLSGERSVKCMDNLSKIVSRNARHSMRTLFSTWHSNIFNTKKVTGLTSTLVSKNSEYRTKARTLSSWEENFNIQQVKLLNIFDKGKHIYRLRLKCVRRDLINSWTKWTGKIQIHQSRRRALESIGRMVNHKVKVRVVMSWRKSLVSKWQQAQDNQHRHQHEIYRQLSYAWNRIREQELVEGERRLRVYFDRSALMERAKSQVQYHKRLTRILQIMESQHRKNELRSALYLFHSKCVEIKAKEAQKNFQIIQTDGEGVKKKAKSSCCVQNNKRKKLLVLFLDRFLNKREDFYNTKLSKIVHGWGRKMVLLSPVVKGALRKVKLSAFTSLLNHSTNKKYKYSPKEMQVLRDKVEELGGKEQQEVSRGKTMDQSIRLLTLCRLCRWFEGRQLQDKQQLFECYSALKLRVIQKSVLKNGVHLLRKCLLRCGFNHIKKTQLESQLEQLHLQRYSMFVPRKSRSVMKVVLDQWRSRTQKVTRMLKVVSLCVDRQMRESVRRGHERIKEYSCHKYQLFCERKALQLNTDITSLQVMANNSQEEMKVVLENTNNRLKEFIQYFSSNRDKMNRYCQREELNSSLERWRQANASAERDETKLEIRLNKISSILTRRAFLKIVFKALSSISHQFKQKIASVLKKDKNNQLKIEKGDAAFGGTLKKENETHQTVLLDLHQKEERLGKLMDGHQHLYKQLHEQRMVSDCWGRWTESFKAKRVILRLLEVWDLFALRRSFKAIVEFSHDNEERCRKARSCTKTMQFINKRQSKGWLTLWRELAVRTRQGELEQQRLSVQNCIESREEERNLLLQKHANLKVSSRLHLLVMRLFGEWKSYSFEQGVISRNTAKTVLVRKVSLFSVLTSHLRKKQEVREKAQKLKTYIARSTQRKQGKVLSRLNSNIGLIRTMVKRLGGLYSHSKSSLLFQCFSRIERAGEYKVLAYRYQQKKSSYRLMGSLITQAQLNKIKTFYTFMSYCEKTHHYLPNVLICFQKKLVQLSLFKIKEAASQHPSLISTQIQHITQKQKRDINLQMRQILVDKINPQQLKEYLDKRGVEDQKVINKAVCRLRMAGGKRRMIKGWNTWIEAVQEKKLIKQKLMNVINLNSTGIRYWNRWKNCQSGAEEMPISAGREELVFRHEELRKVSILYRRQLLKMRSEVTELRCLNNSQNHQLSTTTKIVLNRVAHIFGKGLSSVLSSWKQKAAGKLDRSRRYKDLTKEMESLLSRRELLYQRTTEVNASNKSLRENCKESGVQAERLRELLMEKENLSISLADKKHDMKILLQDNLKIKQKLKQAQGQAVKLASEFNPHLNQLSQSKPLMDRTNR